MTAKFAGFPIEGRTRNFLMTTPGVRIYSILFETNLRIKTHAYEFGSRSGTGHPVVGSG